MNKESEVTICKLSCIVEEYKKFTGFSVNIKIVIGSYFRAFKASRKGYYKIEVPSIKELKKFQNSDIYTALGHEFSHILFKDLENLDLKVRVFKWDEMNKFLSTFSEIRADLYGKYLAVSCFDFFGMTWIIDSYESWEQVGYLPSEIRKCLLQKYIEYDKMIICKILNMLNIDNIRFLDLISGFKGNKKKWVQDLFCIY